MSRAVVVVAGGDEPVPATLAMLPPGAAVIAADSGLDHAVTLGLEPTVVVGDMDSVGPGLLEALGDEVEVVVHPVDKDASDLELAVSVALGLEPDEIVVVGGHGGRLDHLLTNVALLTSEAFVGIEVRWFAGRDVVIPVRDHLRVEGRSAATISLVPIGGPARGVTTRGLRWELAGEDLEPTSSRTISNQFTGTEAEVWVREGVLVVVLPEAIQTEAYE